MKMKMKIKVIVSQTSWQTDRILNHSITQSDWFYRVYPCNTSKHSLRFDEIYSTDWIFITFLEWHLCIPHSFSQWMSYQSDSLHLIFSINQIHEEWYDY
jgi:hypothetical protein